MNMTLILSEAGQSGEPGARLQRVRFKDREGNVLLELRTTAAVEVAHADGGVFAIDASGNVVVPGNLKVGGDLRVEGSVKVDGAEVTG